MCVKGIRANNPLSLDLEGHPGDDGVIGKRSRAEIQDGAILLVVAGISDEERGCLVIDPDPSFVVFARLDHPAIVRACRLEDGRGRGRNGQFTQENIVPFICIIGDQLAVEG